MVNSRENRAEGTRSIIVSGDATVATVKSLQQAFLEALGSAGAVHVVCKDITAVDVTLPQLLCAAHRTAAEMQKALTVEGADRGPLAALLQQAGFIRQIGCLGKTRRSCLWIGIEQR